MAVAGLLASLAPACSDLPDVGDPCESLADNVCEAADGPGLYACDEGAYVYLSCGGDLCQPNADSPNRSWSGACGRGSSGNDVCFCASGGSGGSSSTTTSSGSGTTGGDCSSYGNCAVGLSVEVLQDTCGPKPAGCKCHRCVIDNIIQNEICTCAPE